MTTATLTRTRYTTAPLHPKFGLEVRGLDLTRPLDPAMVRELGDLVNANRVLLFRDQTITPEQLNRFAEQFGNTKQEPPAVARPPERDHNVSRLGNLEDGPVVTDPLSGYRVVARVWHSDSSWRTIPNWLTVLSASEFPKVGGGTEFSDLVSAYEALSDARKALLEGKQSIHSWAVMRDHEPSIPPMTTDEAPEPVTHPVVRTVAGRKTLFINPQLTRVIGNMPYDEGKALFEELVEHVSKPEFCLAHNWSKGDVAMWDNRSTLHRAMPYDLSERRVMFRAEVIGTEAPV